MFEVLAKPIEVTIPQPEFVSVSSISAKLRRQEIKKEQRRRFQMEASKKRKLAETSKMAVDSTAADSESDRRGASKRARQGDGDPSNEDVSVGQDAPSTIEKSELAMMLDEVEEDEEEWTLDPDTLNFKPVIDVRGHTSYLTFATMYPLSIRQQLEERDQHKREAVMKRTAELAGVQLSRVDAATSTRSAGGAPPSNSLALPSQATSNHSAEFNTSYIRDVDECESSRLSVGTL
jgi:tRNA (adenine57-N1/adenine58-N1)-methyltransferase